MRLQSFERRRRFRRTTEFTYVGMDVDKGMLSRQKRLSMEKRLRIEVTYEFEVRTEEPVAVMSGMPGGMAPSPSPSPIPPMRSIGEDELRNHGISAGRQGSAGYGDMDQILPRKPSMTLKKEAFRR